MRQVRHGPFGFTKRKESQDRNGKGVVYFLDEKTGMPSGQNRNIFTEYRNIENTVRMCMRSEVIKNPTINILGGCNTRQQSWDLIQGQTG